ncbi:MAG: hypothetical protein ACRCUE_01110 [Bosea sp. (in: a-proteobacteria)]
MTRQLLLGIAAAAALGAATLLAPTPASAQSWSLSIGQGGGFQHGGYGHGFDNGHRRGPYRQVRPDGWNQGWNRGDHHGGGHWNGGWRGRQVYGGGFGHQQPHCVVRKVRYWDGWGWVVDRRRVCN